MKNIIVLIAMIAATYHFVSSKPRVTKIVNVEMSQEFMKSCRQCR